MANVIINQRCAPPQRCEVLTPEEIYALRDLRSPRCRQMMLGLMRAGREPGSLCSADTPECRQPTEAK